MAEEADLHGNQEQRAGSSKGGRKTKWNNWRTGRERGAAVEDQKNDCTETG